jgi:hypothetical protein
MKLSAEQFADLAASFEPESRARPRQERRRAPRLELSASLSVRVLKDEQLGRAVTVQVEDFSARGLAILHPARLEPGSRFVVQLARQSGGVAVMLCTVMHARRVGDEVFRIGAEFTCQLGEHPGGHAPADEVDAQLRRLRDSAATED